MRHVGDGDGDALNDAEGLNDGDIDVEGDSPGTEGDAEADGLVDAENDALAEADGLRLAEGDVDALTEDDGDAEAEAEDEGLIDAEVTLLLKKSCNFTPSYSSSYVHPAPASVSVMMFSPRGLPIARQ